MLKPEYKTLNKILANDLEVETPKASRFTDTFEMTDKVSKFLEQYDLMGDIELIELAEGQDEDEQMAKLKPEVAAKLESTYNLFISEEHADKRFAQAEEGVKEWVEEHLKKLKADILTFDIELKTPGRYMGEAYSFYITLKDPNEHEEEVPVLHYSYEAGLNLAEYAEQEAWAAFLGIDDSPFYDSDFVDAYDVDNASIAMDEFTADLDRSQDKFDLEKAIKDLVENYKPIYSYVIDLNERGSFRAHVEDYKGETVYEVSNENLKDAEEEEYEDGELWLVADGFMRHAEDVAGLSRYLQDMGTIPKGSEIVKQK
jgi:hypothetical protein